MLIKALSYILPHQNRFKGQKIYIGLLSASCIFYCKCVGLSVFNTCPMLLYVLKLILVRTCLKRAAFGSLNRLRQLFDFPFIYKKSQELYPSVCEESLLYKYISPLCLHSKCRLRKNMAQVQRRFVYNSKFTIRS